MNNINPHLSYHGQDHQNLHDTHLDQKAAYYTHAPETSYQN
jgi:hypothetical protein